MKKEPIIIEEWGTPIQIELVKDLSRTWQKKQFRMMPGFWIFQNGMKVLGKVSEHEHLPEGAVRDDTAWNHEHCELCWTTISENADHQQEGYTDEKDWLCIACYTKYIAPTRPPTDKSPVL